MATLHGASTKADTQPVLIGRRFYSSRVDTSKVMQLRTNRAQTVEVSVVVFLLAKLQADNKMNLATKQVRLAIEQ